MPRSFVNRIVVATVAGVLAGPAAAQDQWTQVTLTVSPTFVDFAGFGGGFGAGVAQLSIARYFTPSVGGEVSAFAIVPAGGAAIEPSCVPGATCQSRSTPGMLNGVLLSPFAFVGGTSLRATVGIGGVRAVGGEGPGARASLAGAVGFDWVSRSNSRFAPTIGVRLVQLRSPIAGARQLFLPGVGLAF